MTTNSVLLVGGPDSGKTNYVARLWIALDSRCHSLRLKGKPSNITYVEEAVKHLMQGAFAPRSNKNFEAERQDCIFPVSVEGSTTDFELVVPDISGELWKSAVETMEISAEWMTQMQESAGAILFVRPHSDQIVVPLDWITAAKYLKDQKVDEAENLKTPTQVMLCELLRFLEHTLQPPTKSRPRISVVVTAWDSVSDEEQALGPYKYLKKEFPLFAGMVKNSDVIDFRIFAVSVVGGDFDDEEFKGKYLEKSDIAASGFCVSLVDDVLSKGSDLTLPVIWALGL